MANKIVYRTEDEVRDSAKIQLGFDKVEANVKQGTGQITTFNQLGFKGVIDKPDGWYLPDDGTLPAIILETKSEQEDISLQKWVNELIKNLNIVRKKYKNVCGILYNGVDIRVFKNDTELCNIEIFLHTFYINLLFHLIRWRLHQIKYLDLFFSMYQLLFYMYFA